MANFSHSRIIGQRKSLSSLRSCTLIHTVEQLHKRLLPLITNVFKFVNATVKSGSVLCDISKISSVLAILTKFGVHRRELFRRFKSLSFVPRKAELDIDVNLLFFRIRHSKRKS